jgi:hypothetical protein
MMLAQMLKLKVNQAQESKETQNGKHNTFS